VTVTPKQAALRIIEQMPADASLEDIMYELYFRQRVDRGLQELDAGQTISHEEVKRNLVKWLQSSGQ
jgi:predicted transcriptional regulator